MLHADRVSEIGFIVQNIDDGAAYPPVRSGGIQIRQCHSGLIKIVVTWIYRLFFRELSCDLLGAPTLGTQLENVLDHLGGFWIGDDLFGIALVFFVPIGWSCSNSFPTLSLL